ncbi:MAG: threonine--tRNA ligase [Patescibacteria group bacterium]|nr:threonine--tRNA ligase [Patescibacteria group bacterium]
MKSNNLSTLRHSTEHVLTQAMINLYGKKIIMAMGPATNEGFYFDFESKQKISESDFPKIEKEMSKIISKNLVFKHQEISIKKARELFKDNKYKQEWLDEIENKKEKAIVYWTGDQFVDLCSGPHLKSTGQIKAFKLLSIAGAYWHGDEKNKMLTRIYGTAFESKKELDSHLKNLELAEQNNHRKLGKKLELFTIFPELGSGLPVWLPNGYAMRRALEDYMIQLERQFGYQHVLTPHIHKKELFETSGHLKFYKDAMYSSMKIDDEEYYLKPMNCPAGMLIYKHQPKSYRDLPLKLGELGTVYRYEKSGELHGLQRVRGFTQNDAHIFCTKKQLFNQIQEVFDMLKIFYKAIGFDKYSFVLATSDPKAKKYQFCGEKQDWKWAEDSLKQALIKNKLKFVEEIGEAAFYGPKIDIIAENVYGKKDAISTIQIDFNLPEKFKLNYINGKGKKEQPFIIHRALVGSFERFFAFLIEHYAGAFPVWLSPIQAIILTISDKQNKYAKTLTDTLIKRGIRVKLDNRSETLGSKIRDAENQKIPYALIVGAKEVKNNQISVRQRKIGDIGTLTTSKFIEKIKKEIEEKIIN